MKIYFKNIIEDNLYIVIFLFIFIITIICLFITSDPDLFWHLKNGERIVQEGILPVRDAFSFTGHGRFLVAYEWFAETVYFIINRTAGYAGLLAVSFIVISLTLIVFYWLIRSVGLDKNTSALLTLFLFFNLTSFISIRTQLFSFLFFVVTFYIIHSVYYNTRWAKVALLFLILIWAQFHGGFILGIIMLFVKAIDEIIYAKKNIFRALMIPLVACMLVGMHPSGYYSLMYPAWMFLKRPAICSRVLEWQSFDFNSIRSVPFLTLLVLLTYYGIGGFKKKMPLVIFTLISLIAALQCIKYLPYASIMGIYMLALKLKSKYIELIKPKFIMMLSAAILIIMLYSYKDSLLKPSLCERPLLERDYPRAAAEFIKKQYPGHFIFNPYHWGGYLIYKLFPHNLVFIDGRADLYWKLMSDEYQKIISLHPETLKILDEFNIPVACLPKDFKLASLLWVNQDWELVFEDTKAYVFVRKSIVIRRKTAE